MKIQSYKNTTVTHNTSSLEIIWSIFYDIDTDSLFYRTIWNRYCISILRKLLPEMEYASWSTKESDLIGHIQELEHILGSHKVSNLTNFKS